MDAEFSMYIEKMMAEPTKNRAMFWISKSTKEEQWPTDIEIRKLCMDTYPCEITAYGIDSWGSQDMIRVVSIECCKV
jgi:hypothetical protein